MTRGVVLHNGIVLPPSWPPDHGRVPRELVAVPYLLSRPGVVPIDVGRQLFVDDFLIERTSLTRVYHRPEPHPGNPVLKPETRWETGDAPFAMPFSDGVWFDPADNSYKLWYTGNEMWCTCLAVSQDGFVWHRPECDVVPGTNIVLDVPRDSSTVWLDHLEADPARRFKMVQTVKARLSMAEPLRGNARGDFFTYTLFVSADGVHWTSVAESDPGQPIGDRSTVWFDPFRSVWVFSIRDIGWQLGRPGAEEYRVRLYSEHPDLRDGLADLASTPVPWTGGDELDPPHPHYPDQPPQLYNLDAIAYESLMIGQFSIHQGPENEICEAEQSHKRNQIALGFSRDGFHWHRPDRRPFVGAHSDDPDAWNWGNIQSAAGGLLVVGDELRLYHSGRRLHRTGVWDAGGATGFSVLRRDGFASLDAGADGGILVTRPLRFTGRHMFVNLKAPRGRLRVGVLNEDGGAIAGFGLADCVALSGDGTRLALTWSDRPDLAELADRTVRFRFELFDGALYAFWVSRWESGESGGHMAGGGPGIRGGIDVPASP